MAIRAATRRRTLLVMAAALAIVGLVILVRQDRSEQTWLDGQRYGDWLAVYNGYGETTSSWDSDVQTVRLHPAVAERSDVTHAGLVVSNSRYGDAIVTARTRTVNQLRDVPNPWEVGWLLWRYSDPDHFYALVLKPNGWELSKQDPRFPGRQRFLASGTVPIFAIGPTREVSVRFRGDRFDVSVDGAHLTSYRDLEDPYLTGSVGLYSEDAVVDFSGISVTPDPAG